MHCVKKIRIRGFSGPYFPAFGHFSCNDGYRKSTAAWKYKETCDLKAIRRETKIVFLGIA